MAESRKRMKAKSGFQGLYGISTRGRHSSTWQAKTGLSFAVKEKACPWFFGMLILKRKK
jgi:hypothetical protein